MKTMLDAILSGELPATSERCSGQMSRPHWRSRRAQRLHPAAGHSVSCQCNRCRNNKQVENEYSDTDFHTYWRRRRRTRLGWPLKLEMEAEDGPFKPLVQAFLRNQGWARRRLAEIRKKLNIPPAGMEGKKKYTAALLIVGNKIYEGINAHGNPNILTVNAISRTHAEGDVFNKAKKDGLSAPVATLIVDRAMCVPCGVKGAVTSMARQIGLKKLIIIEPGSQSVLSL